jgi:hypothetical protein
MTNGKYGTAIKNILLDWKIDHSSQGWKYLLRCRIYWFFRELARDLAYWFWTGNDGGVL